MSQVEPSRAQEVFEDLSAEDHAWLEERLNEYRELLEYLHDH